MAKSVLIAEDVEEHSQWEGNSVEDVAREFGETVSILNVDSFEDVARLVMGEFEFDCAVLDIMIFEKAKTNRLKGETPYFSHGISSLDELLKVLPREKILVYTQFPIPEVSKELLVRGVQDRLLVKPAHFEEFEAQIRLMLWATAGYHKRSRCIPIGTLPFNLRSK